MGEHKPVIEVGGRPLVARVLDAAGKRPALVVGPGQGVPEGVRVVMEAVPGGGPVAGLAAAVDALTADAGTPLPYAVTVLAADLPFVTSAHLERLLEALDEADLAVTVDADGRHNWLCAAWRLPVLRRRLDELGDAYGSSMRELARGIRTQSVDDPSEVALDVDTPADLARARDRADRSPTAR
ncbi:molybdenum cofactor guanylyltransferase [Terrabacter aerolatus]|uniref:Molybdenum cofactor guanylyltransferase n=1 Tax=Terrabacter aerolatus TaxID=422442 RepID=A0A512CWM2_9MICO|nr:NTP transferase domain-containing protein [Terrabacter aerolatus]GEO28629.1 molybdenum cofactor guanylyltransferase [Terrabacter aerolatus]